MQASCKGATQLILIDSNLGAKIGVDTAENARPNMSRVVAQPAAQRCPEFEWRSFFSQVGNLDREPRKYEEEKLLERNRNSDTFLIENVSITMS